MLKLLSTQNAVNIFCATLHFWFYSCLQQLAGIHNLILFQKYYSSPTKPNSRWIVHTFLVYESTLEFAIFTRCRFCIYKLYYQHKVLALYSQLRNFARFALIAGEKYGKINFFSVTMQNTNFVNFWENFFLIRVTNKSVVRHRVNPNCKFQLGVVCVKENLCFASA